MAGRAAAAVWATVRRTAWAMARRLEQLERATAYPSTRRVARSRAKTATPRSPARAGVSRAGRRQRPPREMEDQLSVPRMGRRRTQRWSTARRPAAPQQSAQPTAVSAPGALARRQPQTPDRELQTLPTPTPTPPRPTPERASPPAPTVTQAPRSSITARRAATILRRRAAIQERPATPPQARSRVSTAAVRPVEHRAAAAAVTLPQRAAPAGRTAIPATPTPISLHRKFPRTTAVCPTAVPRASNRPSAAALARRRRCRRP